MKESHRAALLAKHNGLDKSIEEELNRPQPDEVRLTALKKEKLHLKEQLELLQGKISRRMVTRDNLYRDVTIRFDGIGPYDKGDIALDTIIQTRNTSAKALRAPDTSVPIMGRRKHLEERGGLMCSDVTGVQKENI